MKQKSKQSAKIKRRNKTIRQIVEYLISGGAYFWSGYVAFFIFYQFLHWSLWWAKITADIVGWVVNYALQRYWVFNNSSLAKNQVDVTGRYLIITGVDFILDYVIVKVLAVNGLTPYLGQFVSAGFFTVWNYLFYKFWVFPNRHASTKHLKRRPA